LEKPYGWGREIKNLETWFNILLKRISFFLHFGNYFFPRKLPRKTGQKLGILYLLKGLSKSDLRRNNFEVWKLGAYWA